MKTGFAHQKAASGGNIWTAVVIFALCLGLGVTGTLLWVENRPKATVATSPATSSASVSATIPASAASEVAASLDLPDLAGLPGLQNLPNTQNQLPPASLTAGMSPRQAALTLANWYYDHHQHDLAVKSFRRAVALGVTHPNVRTDLGNALRLNGQPQEALKQYQIAQQQDPTHEPSLFNQGALYATALKNRIKGIEVWRLYLKRFPKGAQAAQARQLIAKFGAK